MRSIWGALAFFSGCMALACSSSSSDGPAQCGVGCAGSSSSAGAAPGHAGSTTTAGGPSATGGADDDPIPPDGSDDGNHHYVTTPECLALADCCATPEGEIVDGSCYDVIITDMPDACTAQLATYAQIGCPNVTDGSGGGASGGSSGASGGSSGASGAGGSAPITGTPIFGKGFSTAACTSDDECLAVIAAFGAGSDCDGTASVSCPFDAVSGCCIYANAESCYYHLTSAQLSDRMQACQGLGNWSATP